MTKSMTAERLTNSRKPTSFKSHGSNSVGSQEDDSVSPHPWLTNRCRTGGRIPGSTADDDISLPDPVSRAYLLRGRASGTPARSTRPARTAVAPIRMTRQPTTNQITPTSTSTAREIFSLDAPPRTRTGATPATPNLAGAAVYATIRDASMMRLVGGGQPTPSLVRYQNYNKHTPTDRGCYRFGNGVVGAGRWSA